MRSFTFAAIRADFLHAVRRKLERRAIGRAQRRVLFRQGVLRLRHDAHEIRFGQRRQLHPNRETAPAAPESDRSACDMKCAGRK